MIENKYIRIFVTAVVFLTIIYFVNQYKDDQISKARLKAQEETPQEVQ